MTRTIENLARRYAATSAAAGWAALAAIIATLTVCDWWWARAAGVALLGVAHGVQHGSTQLADRHQAGDRR